MGGLTAGKIGGTERGFVNDSENAFKTFILFTNASKSVKSKTNVVNAGEQNCSRTFTDIHEHGIPLLSPRRRPGPIPSFAPADGRVGPDLRRDDGKRNRVLPRLLSDRGHSRIAVRDRPARSGRDARAPFSLPLKTVAGMTERRRKSEKAVSLFHAMLFSRENKALT